MMKISIKREQNNACIGSAEREKFGAKLNAMKHIIWMAALVLTAATWSACSNREDLTVTEQPEQPRTFTVTTTLSPKGGAQTRSTMTDNGNGSISAEWEVGDQLWVSYHSINGNHIEYVKTTAEVTAVNPLTKAATITLTLTDPWDGGDIDFGYPRSYWEKTKDEHTDQKGTLDDINANFAAIIGSGAMTVSGSNVTLPAVTMEPYMCIWKFSFTDGTNDITRAITKLVIDFPEDDYEPPYVVTPSSLGTIYVALCATVPFNAQPICITAQTASGVYRKTATSAKLVAGKTYTTTGYALKKAEVGKVFGADGNIYDNAAATPGGNTALALITYVGGSSGENSPYNHGLALALSDANGGGWCYWTTSCFDAGHTKQTSGSFISESGLQYNNATHNSDTYPAFKAAMANNGATAPTGCSAWFLPTIYQWDLMINACKNVLGTNNNWTDLRDGFTNVGGTNIREDPYWSSTEYDKDYAWRCSFTYGNFDRADKPQPRYVRSVLAF